jgi:hypothetical protein
VGEWTSQEGDFLQSGHFNVANELAAPVEVTGILFAQKPRTDALARLSVFDNDARHRSFVAV